jgi:hypothetical protein
MKPIDLCLIRLFTACSLLISCNKEIEIKGIETFEVTRGHKEGRLTYITTPPVGGEHSPNWQNCGIYDTQIALENAVHSLEHGALWVTYRPDLNPGDVQKLQDLLRGKPYTLLSPYQFGAMDKPVVAVAWGLRLQLESVDDPRLSLFVTKYANGPQSPERGGECTGGIGNPIQ